MKTGDTSVPVLFEQLVHSFLKQWKNRSEGEEVLHQRWGKSIRKRNDEHTANSQTMLLLTQMHKLLLYINTDIFLPTRRGKKQQKKMITVRAAAAPLSRSSGSVTDHQKRRFSSSDHRNFTWWHEQVRVSGRKWRQDFFFSAEDHSFQTKPNSFSVQTFFFFFSVFLTCLAPKSTLKSSTCGQTGSQVF